MDNSGALSRMHVILICQINSLPVELPAEAEITSRDIVRDLTAPLESQKTLNSCLHRLSLTYNGQQSTIYISQIHKIQLISNHFRKKR